MSYKMNGSPAKMGTIQGTSGHRSALQNASPNKGVWDTLKGVFSKKKLDTSKYDDMTDEQLEAERSKRSKIQDLAKSDRKSGKKGINWDKELGDFWRVSQGGPWNEKVRRGKKGKKSKDFDNTDESNKLDAKPKHQNVHTGDPKASEFKTKKGDWMTVAQNVKSVEKDIKDEKKEKKHWEDYKLGDYGSGKYQLGKR